MRTTNTPNARHDNGWLALAVALLVLVGCASQSQEEPEAATTAPALSPITFVQGNTGRRRASFADAQTAGDLNVVIIGWEDATTSITGVTDTLGNVYSVAAPMVTGSAPSSPLRQAMYYAKNIKAGTNTVTVGFSKTPTHPDLRILEYSGADKAAPLDVTASGSGTASGTSVSTATATTTVANELIVGAGMSTSAYAGAGSSFTQRFITSDGSIAEDRIAGTVGAYAASAVLTNVSQAWLMQMATFKAAPTSTMTLTGISPTSGTTGGGTAVTLNGANFVSGATVSFCGVSSPNVTFVSASQLTATTPAHTAGACDVSVTNPNGQSATLPAGFTYTTPSAAIAWVQTSSGGHGATSATFSLAQTAGNLNVVIVGWGDNTNTITSVTDTNGNAYAVAAPMLTGTGTVSPPLRQAIYYAKNIRGGANNTVTVQFSGAPTYPDIRMLEYTGLDPTGPLDVTASGSGNSSGGTVSTASATTSASYELIVGAGMTTAASYGGPGSSFTERVITADGNIAEDRIVSATGGYGASAVLESVAQSWLLQMVTFKAGSGSCTPTTCLAQGDNCGSIPDGCGGTLDCGTCTAPDTCGGGGTPNVCGASSTASYSTSFPLTENPISEGGHWIGGQTAGGNLWGNVQTTPGLAFGVSQPTTYGDPTALLTGTWGPSQTAQGTVRITSALPTSGCCREIELRLRQTISPNTITGYEVYCSLISGTPYCHVASWGGPNGAWVNLDGCVGTSPSTYLRNGDVLKATVTGTNPVVITAYLNGAQIMQVSDTGTCTFSDGKKYGPWTSGSPGIGFYGGQNDWSSFGWSNFSATSP